MTNSPYPTYPHHLVNIATYPPHYYKVWHHCERCWLQVAYPGQYDGQGNPIPAVPAPVPPVPASPTGRTSSSAPPSPQPLYTPALTPDQQALLTYFSEPLVYDPSYNKSEPPVEAPDFIGPRGTYKVERLGWDWKNDPDIEKGYYEEAEYAEANLVGSKTDLEPDGHLPCIDLDLPAHLEPSSKPDHYHLYINKVVPWDKYVNLLNALHEAGLINEGFKEMSIRRGQSYVRRPGVYKQPGEGDS